MIALTRPHTSADEAFRTCITSRAGVLDVHLAQAVSHVVQAAVDFEVAAQSLSLTTLPIDVQCAGGVSSDQLKEVYDNRMVKARSKGRAIYDRLMSAPPHGRCPLCGIGAVSTLDHHLPKARFPLLSVVPANLVPVCRDCNWKKLEVVPSAPENHPLHPYFDRLEAGRWLFADCVEVDPPVFEYRASPPADWNAVLRARIVEHFRLMSLSTLFASNAARRIEDHRFRIVQLRTYSGLQAVRDYLLAEFESHERNDENSWATALFDAALHSQWIVEHFGNTSSAPSNAAA